MVRIRSYLLVFALFSFSLNAQLPIKRVIIWGHKLHTHTHSYIHWAFDRAFKHLGYETRWLDDRDNLGNQDLSGTLFFAVGGADTRIPVRNDCFYILHNVDQSKYAAVLKSGRAITMQVYTHDCCVRNVHKIEPFIYEDWDDKTLYMPWATDLLPHEIDAIKKEVPRKINNRLIYWIGSIWGGAQGNLGTIDLFRVICQERQCIFQNVASCSMEDNIKYVQNSLFAPAIQGAWQSLKGYIPCRIFKNISYGHFGVTNSEAVYELFDRKIIYHNDLRELFKLADQKAQTITQEELHEQMDFVRDKHTYLNRIDVLLNFLERAYTSKQR